MTNMTHFTRTAIAAVGALVISTACIAAAVGPAASPNSGTAVAAVQAPASAQAHA